VSQDTALYRNKEGEKGAKQNKDWIRIVKSDKTMQIPHILGMHSPRLQANQWLSYVFQVKTCSYLVMFARPSMGPPLSISHS